VLTARKLLVLTGLLSCICCVTCDTVHLQEAVGLYDVIATRVAQPRLTEVELRLWLASKGCDCSDASRTIKLLKSLVLADPDSHSFAAWEWAAGWTWVQHALEVHGVSWRA
jgi:hypothetical protein